MYNINNQCFLYFKLYIDLSRYFLFRVFLKERNRKTGIVGNMFNRVFSWNFMAAGCVAGAFPV